MNVVRVMKMTKKKQKHSYCIVLKNKDVLYVEAYPFFHSPTRSYETEVDGIKYSIPTSSILYIREAHGNN